MKQLRFVAFLFAFATLLWLSASGQTSQTPTTPATTPAGVTIESLPPLNAPPDTPSTASANSTGEPKWGFKVRFVRPTQHRPTLPKQLPDAPLVPGVTVQRLADRDKPQPAQEPPTKHSIDPGIYMRKTAGLGGVCGSIVSYNFSPGDNPQLESITTCTPSDAVATRRAEGEGKKQPTPRIQRTVFRPSQ